MWLAFSPSSAINLWGSSQQIDSVALINQIITLSSTFQAAIVSYSSMLHWSLFMWTHLKHLTKEYVQGKNGPEMGGRGHIFRCIVLSGLTAPTAQISLVSNIYLDIHSNNICPKIQINHRDIWNEDTEIQHPLLLKFYLSDQQTHSVQWQTVNTGKLHKAWKYRTAAVICIRDFM